MYIIVRLPVRTRGSRQDGHPVAYRLDAGVGARTQTIGAHHDREQAKQADLLVSRVSVLHNALGDARHVAEMDCHAINDRENVRKNEQQEHRHPDQHRFFDAAQVDDGKENHTECGKRRFVRQPIRRQHAEHRIRAGSHTGRNRQNIIHDQRAAGNHADRRRQ